MLIVPPRTGRPGGAAAQRFFAAGALLVTLSTIAGLAGTAALAPRWTQHDRMLLASVVAVGFGLGALVLSLALLALPGVTRNSGCVLRHLLDALVIAAALWFVVWVLVSRPTRLLGDATPAACPALLVPGVVAAVAIGVAAVVGMRCSGPRHRLLLLGGGVVWVALAGVGLGLGICRGREPVALGAAAATGVGLLVVAVARRAPRGDGGFDGDVIRRGTAYAFVPMIAMAVAGMYHVLREGEFTAVGIAAGSVEGFALVARQYLALLDVRAYARRLAEREAHFRRLAHTDPLTGLANRRALLNELERATAAGSPCVLVTLDLDGFKTVNDMRGHDVGDAVLTEVGRRLRAEPRPGDVTARLGGDEFAVLLNGATPAEAQRTADGLLAVLSAPYPAAGGPEVRLSVSVGMAYSAGTPDVPTLLRNADLALRYAKQRGKNRVEQYDSEYDQQWRRRTTIEHELRGAVERGELHLAFQPVVAVPSVRPVGAEALLRWRHPELGYVRPDEFIPLAEQSGQIATLGAWVLDEACRQLSLWLADGHDVWVSVNVSPLELHAPEYALRVAEALRAHQVPPQRLVLEVTEHAVATDLDELIRRLRALRATGVRIALDDFGAGYSSLGQLRNLPIDILKIDHSLVAEQEPATAPAPGRRAFAPMVDIVMRLGHQLGLEVIAEGVTNQAELAVVVEAGCRFGQGALFGWGVPAEHLEAMLDAATSLRPAQIPAPRPRRRALPAAPSPVADCTVPPQVEDQMPARHAQHMGSVDSAREMRQA
ncbi:putative bifunctional diguanylate cyclase/phosphodiesterase [Micromonospora pattaloongensis]|nr:bifunctional diguanylate cyclase/phosphodiesterase [Micromonospora pattaloongensis]